jgi:DNA-binding transcriptional ArsR family regulator
MSGAERDLVSALRAELAAIDPTRACDRTAERAGLDLVDGRIRGGDPVTARLAVRLASTPEPSVRLATDDTAWAQLADHCRLAWLRGRFLARGSLSLAGGRTHLEFVVPEDEAPVLARRLAAMDLPASSRIRRGRGVVTWKSAETVATFLGRIGSGPGLLELEARQVSRTLRGELNRVLNAESANVARSVLAAGRQIAAIERLEADGRLQEQPHAVRLVAAARRETPEATITEIADRLGVHRSAVQRALERLERLGLHDDGGRRERRRDGASRHAARRGPQREPAVPLA